MISLFKLKHGTTGENRNSFITFSKVPHPRKYNTTESLTKVSTEGEINFPLVFPDFRFSDENTHWADYMICHSIQPFFMILSNHLKEIIIQSKVAYWDSYPIKIDNSYYNEYASDINFGVASNIIGGQERRIYNAFRLRYTRVEEYINWQKTIWEVYEFDNVTFKKYNEKIVMVENEIDLKEKRGYYNQQKKVFKLKELVLKKDIEFDDLFRFPIAFGYDFIISEYLKNTMENYNISGVNFEKVESIEY
ncbi:MAG: hypothetical protein R2798_01065 [Chitinophagales bacterium]|nr:hypothetical protein [Bacteroidota bacterium]MCB9043660.1 hypothetical protein [Chitinophagales bacterium]